MAKALRPEIAPVVDLPSRMVPGFTAAEVTETFNVPVLPAEDLLPCEGDLG